MNLWKNKLGMARPTLQTKEFTKSENDHLASLLREYLQRESNDEILEAVVTLQKKADSLQGFVRVDADLTAGCQTQAQSG